VQGFNYEYNNAFTPKLSKGNMLRISDRIKSESYVYIEELGNIT